MNLDRAIEFMKNAHAGQFTKAGEPYWTHPMAVMCLLPSEATDDERCAALLHDVLEDCDYSEVDLLRYGFSERTVELVKALSRPEGVSYMDWIRSIAATGDRGLIQIKVADNKHNSAPERVESLPDNERGIVKRYEKSIKILQEALEGSAA